jgi:hypothetical protein
MHADVLSMIFDSPFVKGALAAITAIGAILKYLKGASDRARHTAVIASRYRFGIGFTAIAQIPYRLHQTIAFASLAAALLEATVLLDENLLGGAISKSFPHWLSVLVGFISTYFVWLFIVAALLYLAFELRAVESLVGWLAGRVPPWRQSLEWPNAMWQIESDDDIRPVLASSKDAAELHANVIINELTTQPRSPNLALRPTNLSDDSAANVLYFGHVIEEYCSEKLHLFFPWTAFYQALANVAEDVTAPFAPEMIAARPLSDGFFATLLAANAHLPVQNHIPNEAGLEAAVDEAFRRLVTHWSGDARQAAEGFIGTDYGRVLKSAVTFLQIEGMRRQFAKLFILWTIKPGATHSPVFRIPFSSGIFLKYIDTGILLTEGSRFDTESEAVSLCFEATQREIVKRVHELLEKTNDPVRVAWRENERQDAATRKLNWTWWVYYRSDTQTYADSRGYVAGQWKRQGKEIIATK